MLLILKIVSTGIPANTSIFNKLLIENNNNKKKLD